MCGQMHGLTPLDADGEVIRPAILWNDQRAAAECDWITERAGGLDELLRMTRNRMLPGFTGGKIVWLRDHEPEHYARMVRLLNPKDYIRYRMTGVYATEVSDASGTGLFDVEHRTWSTELLGKIDVDPALLPDVVESTEQTGTLADDLCAAWGLPAGTPVFGGGGDAVIQTTAMGLIEEGSAGLHDRHGRHRRRRPLALPRQPRRPACRSAPATSPGAGTSWASRSARAARSSGCATR